MTGGARETGICFFAFPPSAIGSKTQDPPCRLMLSICTFYKKCENGLFWTEKTEKGKIP